MNDKELRTLIRDVVLEMGLSDNKGVRRGSRGSVMGGSILPKPTFGTPSNIGVANVEGTSIYLPRLNHVHNHPAGLGTDLHHNQVHGHADHTNRTRNRFIPVVPYSYADRGNWVGEDIPNNEDNNFRAVYCVPEDYVSLVHIHPLIIPYATGNIYWRLQSSISECSQAYNVADENGTLTATAVTADTVVCLPDSAILTGLAIGDNFALRFFRNGADALDTCEGTVLGMGFIFEYIADM